MGYDIIVREECGVVGIVCEWIVHVCGWLFIVILI